MVILTLVTTVLKLSERDGGRVASEWRAATVVKISASKSIIWKRGDFFLRFDVLISSDLDKNMEENITF